MCPVERISHSTELRTTGFDKGSRTGALPWAGEP